MSVERINKKIRGEWQDICFKFVPCHSPQAVLSSLVSGMLTDCLASGLITYWEFTIGKAEIVRVSDETYLTAHITVTYRIQNRNNILNLYYYLIARALPLKKVRDKSRWEHILDEVSPYPEVNE